MVACSSSLARTHSSWTTRALVRRSVRKYFVTDRTAVTTLAGTDCDTVALTSCGEAAALASCSGKYNQRTGEEGRTHALDNLVWQLRRPMRRNAVKLIHIHHGCQRRAQPLLLQPV